MKRKIFRAPFELKAEGPEGSFTAVFATLNVKDHDGDVTPAGAFEDGQDVIIEPWNHGWNLPVGKGVIHADQEKAWVDGQFILDTTTGMDHYKTVKAMGPGQEWSYTFDVLEASEGMFGGDRVRFLQKMDVVGVSPVTRGAGIGTHTANIKGKGDEEEQGGEEEKENESQGEDGVRDTNSDVKPRGIGPEVIRAEIEILKLEAEV